MLELVWGIVKWLIEKIGDFKLKQTNTALEAKRIEAETEASKDKWKAVILTSTGAWLFQLFFIVPLSVYYTSVVLYSLLLCQDCYFPQTWTIAALPSPFMEWSGAIIAFLFLTNGMRNR